MTKIQTTIIVLTISVYITQTNAIVASSINIISSMEEDHGISCIINVLRSSFGPGFLTLGSTRNLTIAASAIETNIIKWIQLQNFWSVQIIGEPQKNINDRFVTVPEKLPVINKNNKFAPSKYYVLVTDCLSNFKNKAFQVIHSKSFNSKAKFVVYMSYFDTDFQEQGEKILKYLWKYQILNSLVIVPQNNYFYHAILTLYPSSSSGECMRHSEIYQLDRCEYGRRMNKYKLFENKLRLNKINNCTIEVCAIDSPPFVINVKNNSGFEIKLLGIIGEKLNITFNYTVKNKTEYYWTRNNESRWEGAQQFMKENYAVGIGNMIANGDIYEDFDVTNTYHFEYLRWITPKAEPAPRWKCLFVIFNLKLWAACLTVFFTSGLMFFILSYINNEIKSYKSFTLSFLTCLQLLIGNALYIQPKTQIIRFVFLLTALYGIIVCSLYQSALINVLTNPLYETQLATQEQILDSGLKIGGTPVYHKIFDTPQTTKIFEDFLTNTSFANRNVYDWLVEVASIKDLCTISNLFYVMYVQASGDKNIANQRGYNQLFITRKNLMSYPVHMLTARSFPFINEFNEAILQITTCGLTVKWINEIKHLINMRTKEQPKHDLDNDINLTIAHLQGAFVVLVFGSILAFVCFLVEVLVFKIVSSRCFKQMCNDIKNKKVGPDKRKNDAAVTVRKKNVTVENNVVQTKNLGVISLQNKDAFNVKKNVK